MKEKIEETIAIENPDTYRKYANKWVAISSDEKTVIASGITLSEAAKQSEGKGVKNPIFAFIPKIGRASCRERV